MPFIANTPESLVARSDSKNPATTCRGITSAGRPCRRPLAATRTSVLSPYARRDGRSVYSDDPQDERSYCWQHREQASMSTQSSPGPRAPTAAATEERSSLDTLADRLGLITISSARPGHNQSKHKRTPMPSSKKDGSSPGHSKGWSVFFCCFQALPDEAPRSPPRLNQRPGRAGSSSFPRPGHPSDAGVQGTKQQHLQSIPTPNTPVRHSTKSSSPFSAAHRVSVVPQSASPQTVSSLMAELAKPISQTDEPGYIYMFWLTPESEVFAPPASAARSLLVPPEQSNARGQRRASDVVASFAATQPRKTQDAGGADGGRGGSFSSSTGTLLLKIGRANNVQRRLNEWKRQCGYDLSLIRYYPYIPSASAGNSGTTLPRKVPHSHKVERLIHIELAGRGLRVTDGEKCKACNREHREWFQVEATRKAVMEVDETIRRWSDWNEGRSQGAQDR